jgi:hypothetical protein
MPAYDSRFAARGRPDLRGGIILGKADAVQRPLRFDTRDHGGVLAGGKIAAWHNLTSAA